VAILRPMSFVHLTSGRLAARALGAAMLVEHATTPHERDAAAQLVALVRRAGVVAEPLVVPGADLRPSEDGLLMANGAVWWPALLLCGVAPLFGFDQTTGRPFGQDGGGNWRVWVVGPPARVTALRTAFALSHLLAAMFVDPRAFARERAMLAVVIGLVGALRQEASYVGSQRALVRWEGREPPPDESGKAEGEATKQLRAFVGIGGLLFGEQIHAGVRLAGTLRRFL